MLESFTPALETRPASEFRWTEDSSIGISLNSQTAVSIAGSVPKHCRSLAKHGVCGVRVKQGIFLLERRWWRSLSATRKGTHERVVIPVRDTHALMIHVMPCIWCPLIVVDRRWPSLSPPAYPCPSFAFFFAGIIRASSPVSPTRLSVAFFYPDGGKWFSRAPPSLFSSGFGFLSIW
jgi:hypothetical protein